LRPWGNLLNDVPRSGEQLVRIVFSVEKYVRSHDEHGLLLGAFASFVRRLGEPDKAIAYARQGYEISPGAPTGIFLGATYRHAGRYDEAIDAYQKALEHDPGNDEVRIDIADLLCLTEQVEAGLAYYEQVLSRTPDHPWAAAQCYYHKYQLTQDQGWKEKLSEFAKAHPDDAHAAHMLGLLGDPFIDFLPEPRDATISIMRHFYQQGKKPSRDAPIGLSHLESPSGRIAAAMYSGQPVYVSVANIPTPDPRYPRRKVKYVLWNYRGTDPVVALDPPRQSALEAVFSLARRPYSLQGWTDQAAEIAAQFDEGYLRELLKVMVYPPYPERGFLPWTWIYRVQVAAALIIAQLGGEWGTSEKREALISLALGPMDWTVDAALVALYSVCLNVEEARADMIDVMRELAENPPDAGAVHYFGALAHCGLRLPGLPPDLRETLKDLEQYL
jgi:hypothetical protein